MVETSESQRAKKTLEGMETVSGANYAVGSSGYYRHKRLPKRGYDWTIKGESNIKDNCIFILYESSSTSSYL